MIKINSISALTFYVSDLKKTAEFYETLGFKPDKWTDDSFKIYVNWFSIEFRLTKVPVDNSKTGSYTCISVLDADEYHAFAISKDIQPDGEVTERPDKSREFVITDPNGYKLVFFSKK